MAKKPIVIDGKWAKQCRLDRGVSQQNFWSPLGVTQSGASRYESGRALPAPTRKLLTLAYVTGHITPAMAAKV